MRRTSGWVALLLTAGLAMVPGPAIGQSIPGGINGDLAVADPIIPLPLGHARMESVGGVYTAAEFVMMRQTNPITRQLVAVRGFQDVDGAVTGDLNGTVVNTDTDVPFIIRGPLVPGNFLGSGTVALFTDDIRGQEAFQPGFAVTIGYKFGSGSAIEFRWMHLYSANYNANASLNPPLTPQATPTGFAFFGNPGGNLEDTFLFAPVVNFPVEFTGAAQETALGNPNSLAGIWNGAINMHIDFTQRYDQYDIKGKVPWYQTEACRCYGTAGGRFAWIWERFRWRTVSADFTGNSTDRDTAIYTNIVSNRMYGPFVGFGVDRYIGGGFALGFEADAAGMVDVVRERAKYVRADKAIESKRSRNELKFTPEVSANANLTWYPWEGVQVRAGYNYMAFFNTIASKEPIAFDFRALDPNWTTKGIRFFDGFNVGIAFIF